MVGLLGEGGIEQGGKEEIIRFLLLHRGPTWLEGVFIPMHQQSDVK